MEEDAESHTNWRYFDLPTPMNENLGTSYMGFIDPPELNIIGGFYPYGEEVSIINSEDNIIYRFTTNGSDPTINDEIFSSIIIEENLILKVRSFKEDYFPSTVITNSYFNDNLLRELPVVSLISDSNYFFGSDSGLLVAGNEAENGFPFFWSKLVV